MIKALEKAEWILYRQESSHLQYKKQGIALIVTINGPDRDEMKPGTLQSIRRITGLELRP